MNSPALADPLVPFAGTGDLWVMDSASGNIIQVTPEGSVPIAVSGSPTAAQTGLSYVSFSSKGIAFDRVPEGVMYFVEGDLGSILKLEGGEVQLVASRGDIQVAQGGDGGELECLALGDDGFLYVNDTVSQNILGLDPAGGMITLHTSRADLESAVGAGNAGLKSGIVAGPGGVLYVANVPDRLVEIDSAGTATLLTDHRFSSIDEFMTRDVNRDLVVVDDAGDVIYRVEVSTGSVTLSGNR